MKPNPELSDRIENYVQYLDDQEYWHRIYLRYELSEITETLLRLLKSGSDKKISDACLWIRDLVLTAPESDLRQAFKKDFSTSRLLVQLEDLLKSPSYNQRETAAYALGKTCSRNSAPAMKDILQKTKDDDPLFVHNLAFEIHWLAPENFLNWFHSSIIQSSIPLTRWTCVDLFDSVDFTNQDEENASRILDFLAHDPDSRVRKSAAHLQWSQSQWKRNRENSMLGSDPETILQALTELDKNKPLSFFEVAIQFTNKMHKEGKNSYSVAHLSEFAQQLADDT